MFETKLYKKYIKNLPKIILKNRNFGIQLSPQFLHLFIQVTL